MGAVCFLAAHNLHVYEAWNTILMLITMNVFTTWNDVAVNALAVRVLDTNQLRGAGATVQLIGWSSQNQTFFRHGSCVLKSRRNQKSKEYYFKKI